MLPKVVNSLSNQRAKQHFDEYPLFKEEKVWKKAQRLQDHIYECNQQTNYYFANKRFFEQDHKSISKVIIERNAKAFHSKTFQNLKKNRTLYIYNAQTGQCDCKSFWHLGYCRHSMAVKIYREEIKVYIFFFNF